MNKEEEYRLKSQRKDKIEYSDRSHVGCIRVNSTNTFEHELAKFIVCWSMAGGSFGGVKKIDLHEFVDNIVSQMESWDDEDFITEARVLNGRRRYDVYGMKDKIYEIETGKSYQKTEKEVTTINLNTSKTK